MKYDLPDLSLSTNPTAVNTGNGLGRGSEGAGNFAKLEVFKGFLSMLLTVRNLQKGGGVGNKPLRMRVYLG